MKLLSFILSVSILSLVVAPVLGTVNVFPESTCCQDQCTAENEQEQQKDHDNGGCSEMCNLFLSCQCGLGFIAPSIKNALKVNALIEIKSCEYRQFVSILVLHTIWHPPKA